jgi:hypothetical protein
MKTWPDEIDVSLSDTADPHFREQIHEAIKAFNDQISPAHKATRSGGVDPLDIAVYDRDACSSISHRIGNGH